MNKLESQLDVLNALPNNQELLGLLDSHPTDETNKTGSLGQRRRISELWQAVQMNGRIEVAEQGIARVCCSGELFKFPLSL
ncbi:hypothetical protein P879_10987 [Paragonimus westermani]|uniref:Uncharacterized protein n=1 Tax=Paragonimus westermani TaxID=34504 RepID=A0A8T0DEV4_9TREM|nr:hypothetical protein P879_10987 [Paragonimus westermani]